MSLHVVGTWELKAWNRHRDDGSVVHPLGPSPCGLLVYGADGSMIVQMAEADRPRLDTDDPVGGSAEQRAQAYSSCLCYFGRYEADDHEIVHYVESALFPNWSHTTQHRPFVVDGDTLTLQLKDAHGRVTNEMIWARRAAT